MSEVRVKLHANINNNVQNTWMSLNYEKKPTIAHFIHQLKKNFDCNDDNIVNLYLDEFWLPPWENSRLLRENDCIRVEINETNDKLVKSHSFPVASSTSTYNEANNYYELSKQNIDQETKLNEKKNLKATNSTVSVNDLNLKQSNQRKDENKKFVQNNFNTSTKSPSISLTSSSTSLSSPSQVITETQKNKQKEEKSSQAKNSKNQLQTNNAKNNNTSKNLNKNSKKPAEMVTQKKFSVANYVHLLNNDNNEQDCWDEEPKADQMEEINLNKKGQSNSYNNNIDKIAQTINATAKAKWKNSNNVNKQDNIRASRTTPQHIRFESSSSSNDDSSDSSSETSSESNNVIENSKNTKSFNQTNKKLSNDNSKKSPKQQKKQQENNWKPMSKEDQLNMVSYNRSFIIQNPKSLNEFKNVFDKTKLNAPILEKNDLCEDEKHTECKRKSKFKSIDYEKLESFNGIPNVNDKIAFQVLEISDNFTPEISAYKAGTVMAYNAQTNTITLKLDGSSYNKILTKPNKFTVIRNEEYENYENSNESESTNTTTENVDEEDIIDEIEFDWASLMNVKKLSKSDTEILKENIDKLEEQAPATVEQTHEEVKKCDNENSYEKKIQQNEQENIIDPTQS